MEVSSKKKEAVDKEYSPEGTDLYVVQWLNSKQFKNSLMANLINLWKNKLKPGMTVVDIACGTGVFTREIQKISGGKTLGIDISPSMLKQAIIIEDKEKQGIEYLEADCLKDLSAFPKVASLMPFDLISMSWILSYVDDIPTIKNFAKNLFKILKRGGGVSFVGTNDQITLAKIKTIEKYGEFWNIPGLKDKLEDYHQIYNTIQTDHKFPPITLCGSCWALETISSAFREAGFTNIEQISTPYITDIKEEEEFYKGYEDCPNFMILFITK